MGKKIDRLVRCLLFLVIPFAALFLASNNLPVSFLLAVALAALAETTCVLFRRRFPRKIRLRGAKKTDYLAQQLHSLLLLPEAEATAQIIAFLGRVYPLAEVQLTPGGASARSGDHPLIIRILQRRELTADEILTLWRTRPPEVPLVLVTTARASEAVIGFARTLPQLRLIDGAALQQLLAREMPRYADAVPKKRPHLRLGRFLVQKHAKRMALYGLTLLVFYFVRGNVVSLLCALCLIGAACLSRRAPKLPDTLI